MKFSRSRSKKWDPKGLHVYITGGSEGLGLALAIQLAKRGAHISIVARNQDKLDKALRLIEASRQSPSQILKSHAYDLTTSLQSQKALYEACDISTGHGGRAPDAVFACAGAATPGFWIEMGERDLEEGMRDGFWVQAWTAFAASKMMARQRKKGKIILVGSTLGYMSFVGYASYSPAKHALRGLADSLNSELSLYDIDVHIFIAPSMDTPGYVRECRTKPFVTRVVEEKDRAVGPERAAEVLVRGIEKNEVHIAGNFVADLFRASTRGSAPKNGSGVRDTLLDLVALIGIPSWRRFVTAEIDRTRVEHLEHLERAGFFDEDGDSKSVESSGVGVGVGVGSKVG